MKLHNYFAVSKLFWKRSIYEMSCSRLYEGYPETGLEVINDDLPEADFGPESLKVCAGA